MLGQGIESDNNPKTEAYSPEHKGEDYSKRSEHVLTNKELVYLKWLRLLE